jgi:hypothetical protein
MMPDTETNGVPQSAGRPFPWHCPRCRRKEVRPATVPYHAERLHEGRLIAVDIPQLLIPRCGNCGELVFNYLAEELILKAVEAQAKASDSVPARDASECKGSPI